jgi:hypothetical protein
MLQKVLVILKSKKSGKKIIKQFGNFIQDFKETKDLFHLTFPEDSSKISAE